jgi:hypothetical protein
MRDLFSLLLLCETRAHVTVPTFQEIFIFGADPAADAGHAERGCPSLPPSQNYRTNLEFNPADLSISPLVHISCSLSLSSTFCLGFLSFAVARFVSDVTMPRFTSFDSNALVVPL